MMLQLAIPEALEAALRVSRPSAGPSTSEGSIVTLRFHGPIVARADYWSEAMGFPSSASMISAVRGLARNESVQGVLLSIDSPGGAVDLTSELSEAIAALATVKPVVAHIEGLGASAAYWIALGANQIFASQTARVGSIGVVSALLDTSQMADKMGVKVIPLRSSDLKGGPLPGTAVSEAMIAQYQSVVDDLASIFYAAVEAKRGISLDDKFGDPGRVFLAEKAAQKGLIDAVGTASDAMKALEDMIMKVSPDQAGKAEQSETATELTALKAQLAKQSAQMEALRAQNEARAAEIEALAVIKAELETQKAKAREEGIRALAKRKLPIAKRDAWVTAQVSSGLTVEALEAVMASVDDLIHDTPESKPVGSQQESLEDDPEAREAAKVVAYLESKQDDSSFFGGSN